MTQVNVEEHPELDNPRGKAEGRVEAAEVYLAEAHDVVDRLGDKVYRAEVALEAVQAQLAEAEAEVPVRETELAEAQAALDALED